MKAAPHLRHSGALCQFPFSRDEAANRGRDMKPLWQIGSLAFFICALTACTQPRPSDEQVIIENYTEAYNQADLEAMSALMSETIQWLAVEGDETALMADGKEDLTTQLESYMRSGGTTSTLSGWSQNGSFVSVIETAHWSTASGEERSQSALAVYEIRDDLIQRVWYYPAE